MAATPLRIGGQPAWAHDEGHRAGTFVTFDALDVGGAFSPRKVHVFLPRTPGPWPTVWMHDGDTAFWPGGVAHDTWDVAGTLSRLDVGPVAVVAVHPVRRDEEYTHADWADGQRPWGRLPPYADWWAERLQPFLLEAFPLSRDPEWTAVAGSSHGGLAATWMGTRRPDLYGMVGAFSPSFFVGVDSYLEGPRPGALRDSPLFADVRPTLTTHRPRFWVDWGGRRDGGWHNGMVERLAELRGRELVALLRDELGYTTEQVTPDAVPRGAELTWCDDPDAGHDEAAWRRRFVPFVHAFLAGARAGAVG